MTEEKMMDKPTNGYFITLSDIKTDALVHVIGPIDNGWKADRACDGVSLQTDLDKYIVDWAWFGPDPEPTGD